jgi:hypothetical protein
MAAARVQSGEISGIEEVSEGERIARRWKKDGFDMRKASSHRESETEVEEMKRWNQELLCWRGVEERERGCEEGLRRRERE